MLYSNRLYVRYCGLYLKADWLRRTRPAVTVREQREAAKAMTQYFRDMAAAKNAEKAKYVAWPASATCMLDCTVRKPLVLCSRQTAVHRSGMLRMLHASVPQGLWLDEGK